LNKKLRNRNTKFTSVSFIGNPVRADEDVADEEEQPASQSVKFSISTEQSASSSFPSPQESEQPEMDDGQIGPSPDVQTTFLITNHKQGPAARELLAGQIVRFLVGFANKGEKDIIVKTCETSFRYPLDFSYHIQNVCSI
jgi:hypothetical protein